MSTRLLLSVLQSLKKGVLIVNQESHEVINFNDSFEEMWGLQGQNLLNASFDMVFKLMEMKLQDPMVLIDTLSSRSRYEVLKLNNHCVYECHIEDYRLDDLTPTRIFVFSDLTTSLKAKEELQLQFNILENILSAIPHSVFWKDINSRYLGCNMRFVMDAGKTSPSEIIGKTDYDMPWTKAESDMFVAYDKKIMTSGVGELNIEETQKNGNGEDTVVLTSKVPLKNAQNEVFGILGIYANITEFKLAQKRIKEQQLMLVNASQLSALGEMSSGIAHEINNPLSIIAVSATYLTRLCEEEQLNRAEVLSTVKSINKTVDRIAKIVMGLRNISRATTGEKSDCSYEEILTDVLGLAQEKFRLRHIVLKEQLPLELTRKTFKANRIQLSQVLVNILNNSYDAIVEASMPEKWIQLTLREENQTLLFSITDSGTGIPEEVRQKIFEPFFTTKVIGKGTGIGLSISRSMIEKNGGKLYYDTTSAHTSFVIEFPLDRASN